MFEFKSSKLKWGLVLIAAGFVVLAHNYGLLSFSFNFYRDWPIILIAFGLMGIWKSISFKNHREKTPLKKKRELFWIF
ncbi:MAG: DUF5668 domain-containing protein [Elusimicrobiota bacterium]|nr:DUF5668 domain-containing protein [Elusimicrobiota bacterium]